MSGRAWESYGRRVVQGVTTVKVSKPTRELLEQLLRRPGAAIAPEHLDELLYRLAWLALEQGTPLVRPRGVRELGARNIAEELEELEREELENGIPRPPNRPQGATEE